MEVFYNSFIHPVQQSRWVENLLRGFLGEWAKFHRGTSLAFFSSEDSSVTTWDSEDREKPSEDVMLTKKII